MNTSVRYRAQSIKVVYAVSWPRMMRVGPVGHAKGLDPPSDKLSANGSASGLCLNLMTKSTQDELRYISDFFSISSLLAYSKQSGFKLKGKLLCGAWSVAPDVFCMVKFRRS